MKQIDMNQQAPSLYSISMGNEIVEYYQINSAFQVAYINHQYIGTVGRKEGSQKLRILKSGLGHSQPVAPNLSFFFLILFKTSFLLTSPAPSSQAGSGRMHHGEGDNVLF